MKAEHRKELETNALADRVGRALQGMKQKPQKRTFVWFALIAVVLVFGWLYMRYQTNQRQDRSKQWVMLDLGAPDFIKQLVENYSQSNQGKAAHFEDSYSNFRQFLRFLPRSPKEVLQALDQLQRNYESLAAQCKEDNVLSPEALFTQAVIAETLIMKSDANVKLAQDAYQAVVDKHKDTAFGKKAQKRLEVFTDEAKKKDLLDTYRELRKEFGIDERPQFLDNPLFPPLKDKDNEFPLIK
jgi:hypothetical protein